MCQAKKAVGEETVSVDRGVNVVRQYLSAGLVDELRLFVAPKVLGVGESIFAGLPPMSFEQSEATCDKTVAKRCITQ